MGKVQYDFRGEVALVTGAASGIGRAVLEALLAAGARVHAFDRVPAPGGLEAARWHRLDLRSGPGIEAAAAELLAEEGRLDLLVNNAGVTRDGMSWKLSDEDWDEVLDVNLGAPFRVLRAFAGALRERGRGRVVQVASINGLRGKAGQANYSAAKAGLVALTRTLARELGPRGITVNAVAPGMVETPMSLELPESVRARALAETCSGRLGRPEDVAGVVLFLLSDAAAHVTGSVVTVDGGQLA